MQTYILGLLMALLCITQALEDLTQFCLNINLGDIIAHPHDCRAYIICNREPSVHYCDTKFHFDYEHKICNWPEFANCQAQAVHFTTYAPFMAIDMQTGNIVDPLMAYDPHNVMCRHFGAYFLPHPITCRSYILCAYGHMHEHACGQGSLWHYKLKQCVLNINAECYTLTPQEALEIEESRNDPLKDANVVCYTVTTISTTPATTTLTTTKISATTTATTTTTTKKTNSTFKTSASTTHRPHATTTTTTVIVPAKKPHSHAFNIVCPHKKQSYVAHPKDCSKYFMCIMGNPVLTSCPQGLMWDSKKEFCDLAKNVKCFV